MKMTEVLDISGRPIRVCGNCEDAPGNGEFCGTNNKEVMRMPTKEKLTGVYFTTADGQIIKVTDITTISFHTDGDEYLANMLDSYEMKIQISDEAMQILHEISDPTKHLMEKIKQAFAEYFYEVMRNDE